FPLAWIVRRASSARVRVSRARRWAALRRWWVLSARIRGLLCFECGDDRGEVVDDLLVRLGEASLAGLGGAVDERDGQGELLAVLGQELRGCQEQGAGQARVGVRARTLGGHPAVPVRQ